MRWILKYKKIWRAILPILLLLATIGPWGHTSDGVPPPEWCHDPYFLLEDGRCVGLVSGADLESFMGRAFLEMLGQLLSGELSFLERGRELLIPLFFSIFLLPYLSGLILLYKESSRMQAIHITTLGLAFASGLWMVRSSPGGRPILLWGIWLYLFAAGCALGLELLVRFSGHPWKTQPAHNPSG